MGIGNKPTLLTYTPKDIFLFENKFFKILDSGIWKNFQLNNSQQNLEIENIYVDNKFFTIIPDELWSHIPENEKRSFLTNDQNNLNYLSYGISKYDSKVYWAIEKSTLERIKKNFPSSNIRHFCESIILFSKYNLQLNFFLGEQCIYISSFNKKKLVLVNRYEIENSDDSLYFILSVIKESKFITQNFNIENWGINDENLISKLKDIFPNNTIHYNKESNYKNF